MEELQSTGDTLEEVQKINELAANFYRLHLAASMADAVEMARNTLYGASRLEQRTATHLPDKIPEPAEIQEEDKTPITMPNQIEQTLPASEDAFKESETTEQDPPIREEVILPEDKESPEEEKPQEIQKTLL